MDVCDIKQVKLQDWDLGPGGSKPVKEGRKEAHLDRGGLAGAGQQPEMSNPPQSFSEGRRQQVAIPQWAVLSSCAGGQGCVLMPL